MRLPARVGRWTWPRLVGLGSAFFGIVAATRPNTLTAQEIVLVDSAFTPVVAEPAFAPGQGSRVLFDEAHHNLDTNTGYYHALGALLEADGYRVGILRRPLSGAALEAADLLVVANAMPAADQAASDTLGSAFTPEEVDALLSWLHAGGSLLLMVDHRPYASSAAPLLDAFGLRFADGYALDYQTWDPLVFRRSDGTLLSHPITEGRNPRERIDSIATFDGDAFRADGNGGASTARGAAVVPLFRFGAGIDAFLPDRLWDIGDHTPHVHVTGWLQGAALPFGRGRAVVFGESGMAVAQFVGPNRQPRGMNAPTAKQNAQLLLNTVHWLTRVIP